MASVSLKQRLFEAMKKVPGTSASGALSSGESSAAGKDRKGAAAEAAAAVVEDQCALSMERQCCCEGKGYKLECRGAFIGAVICPCLRECSLCLGSAYRDDAAGLRSRACSLPLPQRMVNLWNDSSLPVRYFDCELSRFCNFTGNGQQVLSLLGSYLKRFDQQQRQGARSSHRGIVISGPVGVGKTYLLVSLAKALIRQGRRVKFVDFFQLITEIKAGYSQKASEEDILKPLIEVDVLLIDELGKGRNSEFELTILDQLVMGRYNQDKPIIATTNYFFGRQSPSRTVDLRAPSHNFGLDSFGLLRERVGTRIYSRIVEGCALVPLTGRDFRELQSERREERL